MLIRTATLEDSDAIWAVLEPMIRGGETNALPRDLSREQALSYWFASGNEVFVAEQGGALVGTYYLRANQAGGGAHVANCAYVVAPPATGRGIAQAMCQHSLDHARSRGFRAMQFNFVVSNNERAVRLWRRAGFQIIGTIPHGFEHPTAGMVDVFVMHRFL
jgi:ribosomal protein S18 acetylase RimI-like enzyme